MPFWLILWGELMEFKTHKYFVGDRLKNLVFGYTKRTNGVSSYPENSFNMALYIDDDSKNVHKHQELLAEEINIPSSNWVLPIQKHGSKVCQVTSKECGTNVKELTDQWYGVDGLYTYDDVLLTMNFADCVPVYIFSRENTFTGLAHAGWRGTSENITRNLIQAYDGKPEDLTVIIGVSINGSSFNVDDKVINAIDEKYLNHAVEADGEEYQLDLKTVNKNQALECGIREDNIYVTELGTEDTSTFFSYRTESGKTGRALAFIGRTVHD